MNVVLIHILATSSRFYSYLNSQSIFVRSQILPSFYDQYAHNEFSISASVEYLELFSSDFFVHSNLNKETLVLFESLHNLLSSNVQLFHMSQRSIFNKNHIGSNLLTFTRYAFNVSQYLRKNSIDSLIFGVPPHSVLDYIWLLVARFSNLKLFIFQGHTYLPFRSNVYDSNFSLIPNIQPVNPEIVELSNNLFKNYINSGRPLDLQKVPDLITRSNFTEWRDQSLINETCLDAISHYVIFFLSFEPEASTNPMGGIFFEQRFAIEYLRVVIPDNIHIFIKDHPWYTESNCLAPYQDVVNPHDFRRDDFYASLSSLPKVSFLPSHIKDPNAIISRALCTSSLNGTVIFDSLLRGVPSIIFGSSGFANLPGAIDFSELDKYDFTQVLKKAYQSLQVHTCTELICQYLQNSFPGDPYGPCSEINCLVEYDVRMKNEIEIAKTISNIVAN